MNKLIIDTRDNKNVIARLLQDKDTFESASQNESGRPDSILNLIDDVCYQAKIKISEIDEIEVKAGPGSYTGLKVGVSVANALSLSLQKKVNGLRFGELVEPKYE